MIVRLTLLVLLWSASLSPWAQTTPLSGAAPVVSVGDTWRWVRSDRRTGAKENENLRTIKSVSAERVEASETDGDAVMTGDMRVVETAFWVRTPAPQFANWPLAVGKKWDFKYVQNNKLGNRAVSRWEYSAEVVAQEKVKVAAGEFDAFKIVYTGFFNNDTNRRSGRALVTSWYAPAARATVKTEYEDGFNFNVTELVEFKLQP